MKIRRTNRLSLCPETLLALDPPALCGARGAEEPIYGESVAPRCIAVSQIFTRCHNCAPDVLAGPRLAG